MNYIDRLGLALVSAWYHVATGCGGSKNRFSQSANRWQTGATAIEYALIVAVIALIMYTGAQFLGTSLKSFFSDTIVNGFKAAG